MPTMIGVVIEKEKTNLLIPKPLADELRALLGTVGPKRHWTVFSAAVLLLLELPKDEFDYYAGAVGAADFGHPTFAELIAKARSGELRKDAQRRADAARLVASGDLGEPRDEDGMGEAVAPLPKPKPKPPKGKRKTG